MLKRDRKHSFSNVFNSQRKSRLSEATKLKQLSSGERTTRLVLVLTLVGGGWGLLINFYWNFFTSAFSTNLYPSSLFGLEHVLLLWLGVSLCMVISNVLIFIWYELNSFDVERSNLSNRINSANRAFQNIFKSIKVNSIVGLIVFLTFVIFSGIHKQDRVMIWFSYAVVIVVLGFLALLVFALKKHGKPNYKFIYSKIFNSNLGLRVSLYVLLFILWTSLGLGIMAPSQSIDVNMQENKLVLKSTNQVPEEVSIEFIHSIEDKKVLTHSIFLDKYSYLESYQKVAYYPDNQSDMFYSLRNISKEYEMVYQLDQSEEVYYYEVDFSHYMLDGDNEIRISIKSENLGEKITVISTPVIHESGLNKVLKGEFHLR